MFFHFNSDIYLLYVGLIPCAQFNWFEWNAEVIEYHDRAYKFSDCTQIWENKNIEEIKWLFIGWNRFKLYLSQRLIWKLNINSKHMQFV